MKRVVTEKPKRPKSKTYRTIEERAMLTLSAREAETLMDAILTPAEPGCVLRAASQQYKNGIRTR